MGDVMQDLGLEYYNPNHSPAHPHQYSQYMNGMNGVNGSGGVNGVGGMNGLEVNGMVGMNGMNGGMGHGNGGMLPPQTHMNVDHSQQYMTELHHTYYPQDYGHSQVPALPLHGPGGREDIWMDFMHQLTTPDGQPHHNGYQPQMGHHG